MERHLRLRSEADFRRVRSRGRSWGQRLMTLVVAPNDLSHNRYGFVISKRVGNAVTRNLVKRRLRELLRQLDSAERIVSGHDCVFIVRPGSARATFEEIGLAVGLLLTRAALLHPEPSAPATGGPAEVPQGGG